MVERIVLIVLNQLRPLPHNAFVQTFASRPRMRQQAFVTLAGMKQTTISERLLDLLIGLRNQLKMEESMSEAQLPEELTPERVMEIGRTCANWWQPH
ncbi:MAG: hypothetical protein KDE19_15155 [Caldilineaceae bacterium]|nr:hypothetical protein [Caldilineaceae bacterium]